VKLPLLEPQSAQIVAVFEGLERLGKRPVLVGGLVPPLLLVALDPEGFHDFPPRSTADCDLAIDVAVGAPDDWPAVEALLLSLGFSRRGKKNQFCWGHPSGLMMDPMPVPTGIERGDPEAIAMVRHLVECDTQRFYRGYELALDSFEQIELEVGPCVHALRIAGLVAMLAMKLQAWTDRRHQRKRDAQDIAWLLRQLDPQIVVRELRAARRVRADLVDEIVQRLWDEFSDPDHRGVLDSMSGYGNYLGERGERHCREVASAIRNVLELYR
jgi:hypothetical protein